MRVYYHPTVGDYYKRKSFEWNWKYALGVGGGGISLGAMLRSIRKKRSPTEFIPYKLPVLEAAGSLGAGLVGGMIMPKRILSWFDPPPFDAPVIYPRTIPKVVVPSFIGEEGQVLNLLMHHGVGDLIRDYSGLGNDGVVNGPEWVDGTYGWGMSFDGLAPNYLNCGNDPSLTITDTLTLLVWVNPAALGAWNNVFGAPALSESYRLRAGDALGNVMFVTAGTTAPVNYISLGTIPTDRWSLVGATYDKDAGANNRKIYINGYVDSQDTVTGALTVRTRDLYIGDWWAGRYTGLIKMPSIYNVTKDADFMARAFESTRAIFGV